MTIVHSSPSVEAAMQHFNVKNAAAIQVGDLYFFSGLTAIDLVSLEISRADVRNQARLTLENFNAILDDLNLSLDHVVKVTCHSDRSHGLRRRPLPCTTDATRFDDVLDQTLGAPRCTS